MFKLMLVGRSVKELQDKVREAYDELVPDALESTASELGYEETPAVAHVDTTPFPVRGIEAPAAPVAAPASGASTDTRGVPWNASVHSESKALNKDGSWRGRRNGDKEALAQYEKQFLGRPATQSVPAVSAPSAPPVAAHPVARPAIVDTQSGSAFPFPGVAPQVPAAVTQPVVAAPVAQAPVTQAAPAAAYQNIPIPEGTKPAHSVDTFQQNLVMTIAGLIKAKKLGQEYIDSVVKHYGVSSVADIADDRKKTEGLFDVLVNAGLVTKVD